MFGFGKRRKQQDTIALVRAVLEPVYKEHFGRSQPENLARVIVEQSFNDETPKFLGRTVGGGVGITTLAADALRAGYAHLSHLHLPQEAQSACAEALGLLIRRAFTPENEPSLSDFDYHYLKNIAGSLATDRKWQEAVSCVPNGHSGKAFSAA